MIIENNNLAIISNSQFDDLYAISKAFYNEIDIPKIKISGINSFYGYKFLNNLIIDINKYPFDWAILIDEDCFITDIKAMLDLVNYQIKNNIHISGMPDGGLVPLRCFNPISINTYFCILNLKEIRKKYNADEVKNKLYTENLNKFLPKEMLKLPYFSKTIPFINKKCDPYNFEPYYKIFFWLLENNYNIKYLNAKLWNSNTDDFTNIIYNHLNIPFAYHTWRSRNWEKDIENKKRIQNVIKHCKTIKK
jgi:hypothetical protein